MLTSTTLSVVFMALGLVMSLKQNLTSLNRQVIVAGKVRIVLVLVGHTRLLSIVAKHFFNIFYSEPKERLKTAFFIISDIKNVKKTSRFLFELRKFRYL